MGDSSSESQDTNRAHTVNVSAASNATVTIRARASLWSRWLEIAIEQEKIASDARRQALILSPQDMPFVMDEIAREMRASMVAISASAHALDALYGEIRDIAGVSQDTLNAWENNRTRRPMRILETLKSGFVIGSNAQGWHKDIVALFDLRIVSTSFCK
jgi:hypothetical protein